MKIQSEKLISINNLGIVPAVFVLEATWPFFVVPDRGVLNPDENLRLNIYFRPTYIGYFESFLIVRYETGEELSVKLEAKSINLEVCLEEDSVVFEDTYMNLQRSRSVTLHNKSSYPIAFKWKQFASSEIDIQKKKKFTEKIKVMKEYEEARCVNLEQQDIIDGEGHQTIYSRICDDEINELDEDEQFMYKHDNFVIVPSVS